MQQRLGHYRVVEQIGSGGMGVVYRARDERLERDVALKVLTPDSLTDDDARRRFRREALALSRLNHPNIATIHDFETFEGTDVLVMEHIPGASLDELIARGPLPERDVVRLGQQLAAALEAAHERGVIHRDLKPGNVRVTDDGRLKVLDFGLARALQLDADDHTRSITGPVFAGTLPYMAPEQLKGEDIDPRTDIYAAGAVLYEMATGTSLHPGLSGARLLGAILDGHPEPARARNPSVSAGLEGILAKALDKNPQLRYQSARELLVDLERLAAPTTSFPLRPPPHRPGRRAALVTLVVLLLAGTGWLAYREWPRPAAPQPRGRIMIADFENGTGDRGLAGVIRDGLTIQLQQSRYLNVLSREQVLDALRRMERSGVGTLDRATALELCQREAIPLLITGAAHRRGDATWIAVQGIDAVSRAGLFTETTQFRRDSELFDRLDALASRVRKQLGESLTGIEQDARPLARVTTRSIEALKLYSRGSDQLLRGDADGALPLLQSAVGIDPKFAMAHMLLARLYETLGNPQKEREHLAQAYDFRESLTPRERHQVEASYFNGREEYSRTVASLTGLVNLYPGDPEARYALALAYRNVGSYPKAIAELEATIDLDPFGSAAYGDLVLFLARTANYDRARAVYAEAVTRKLSGPKLEWAFGMVLLGEERLDAAREHFRQLEASSAVYAGIARLYLASPDLLQGRLASAAEILTAGLLLDRRSNNRLAEFMREHLLVRTLRLSGRLDEARGHLTSLLDRGIELFGPNEWLIAGTLLAESGDVERAEALLRRIGATKAERPTEFTESCYQNLRGEIALARGRHDEAIQAFRTAAANYPSDDAISGLARTYMARRDWARAREAWRQLLGLRGWVLQDGFAGDIPRARLEIARASRALGDLSTARAEYDQLLSMWRAADDVPLRRAAAAERAALAEGAGR